MRTRQEWLAHPHSAAVAARPGVVAMTPLAGDGVFAAECGIVVSALAPPTLRALAPTLV